MRRAICMLALGAAALVARAAADDDEGPIRSVDYDANEVVTLEVAAGVVLHIVVEPGETYVTHAFGDGKAWDFAVKANHYFLKSAALDADSNLTVVTDRRSYHFLLRMKKDGKDPTLEVVFRYPEKSRKARAAADGEKTDQAFGTPPKEPNLHYSMSGDLDIAPENAWDDRTFTYFKFPGNRDIPAIYMVDADGEESIVNRHSTGAVVSAERGLRTRLRTP
jgi:type IV secretion system protein VirB9